MNQSHTHALYDLAKSRHSCRAFENTPVPQHTIAQIIEIAKFSPYVSGRKNWDIIVIDNPSTILEIRNVVQDFCDQFQHQLQDAFQESFMSYAQNFIAFSTAPVLLLPVFRVTPSLTAMLRDPDKAIASYERDNHVKSIACVSMLILLAAEAHGLGSCFMTGPLLAHEQLLKIIPIPNGRELGALIPIGFSHIKN